MNCGWPIYARYYPIQGDCPIDSQVDTCHFQKMQDDTGGDLAPLHGTWTFNPQFQRGGDGLPLPAVLLSSSWSQATANPKPDITGNAVYFIDKDFFWSWLSPENMGSGCANTLDLVGGMCGFSLQQDDPAQNAPHFSALASCVAGK